MKKSISLLVLSFIALFGLSGCYVDVNPYAEVGVTRRVYVPVPREPRRYYYQPGYDLPPRPHRHRYHEHHEHWHR